MKNYYAKNVLSLHKLKKYLKARDYKSFKNLVQNGGLLPLKLADKIAPAVKKWALQQGVSYYCHWFVPLTNKSAEKLTSFTDIKGIAKLTGANLVKGEVDASSFPCGGERESCMARGYTIWDYSSPMFIDEREGTKVLRIPSVFCSYNGVSLDDKTPLLRATEKLDREMTRLLRIFGMNVKHVYSTLGLEQEYFLIDKTKFDARKDLKLAGRSLLGAQACFSQDSASHYLSRINPKISTFMNELNACLLPLGIVAKIQHNEVAPCQHEIVPIFANVNIGVDQNILLVEKLHEIAQRHNLAVLTHEKPFAGVNGSGKHNNWSLCTDMGINLLDANKMNKHLFMLIFSSIISAVDKHYGLLRLSASSYSNDLRLGGHEAPPSIISVYTGILDAYSGGAKATLIDLGIPSIPKITKDTCDRNRTSPFAFTGSKFEFRMLGSNQDATFCNTILAAALLDEIKKVNQILKAREDKVCAIKQIIKNNLSQHSRIIFNGDNYSKEWGIEAKKRGLKNYTNYVDCAGALLTSSAKKLLVGNGIMSESEIKIRHQVGLENYFQNAIKEGRVLHSMIETQVLPALEKTIIFKSKVMQHIGQSDVFQKNFNALCQAVTELQLKNDQLLSKINVSQSLSLTARATFARDQISPCLEEIRAIYDAIEPLIPAEFMPFPKYDDLLR